MTAGNLQYVDVTLHVLAQSISLQFLAFSWVGSVETLVRTTVESDCSELLRMYVGIFKNGRRWMLVQLYRYSLPAEMKGTAGTAPHRTNRANKKRARARALAFCLSSVEPRARTIVRTSVDRHVCEIVSQMYLAFVTSAYKVYKYCRVKSKGTKTVLYGILFLHYGQLLGVAKGEKEDEQSYSTAVVLRGTGLLVLHFISRTPTLQSHTRERVLPAQLSYASCCTEKQCPAVTRLVHRPVNSCQLAVCGRSRLVATSGWSVPQPVALPHTHKHNLRALSILHHLAGRQIKQRVTAFTVGGEIKCFFRSLLTHDTHAQRAFHRELTGEKKRSALHYYYYYL